MRSHSRSAAWAAHDLLLESLPDGEPVEEVLLGLTWTLVRAGSGTGLAMSPELPTRLLPWSGALTGRRPRDLAAWVKSWNPHEASIGMAAINALINTGDALSGTAVPLFPEGRSNLAVFEYFRPQLAGRRVVVIGRYPGLERLQGELDLTVLERAPGPGDLPDPAADYLLPDADWVFLTATSLVNKTFHHLAELAREATLVLMGPSAPWREGLADFGVDYLAGVQFSDRQLLRSTVAEGGGTRIFEGGVRYAVANLRLDEGERLRGAIAAVAARRDALKRSMEAWYGSGNRRFPGAGELAVVDTLLSELDTRFKRCWDSQSRPRSAAGP